MAGTHRIDVSSIRSFRIPVIPSSAPEVDTPDAFREGVSLMPHQRRALYRMKQVERDGELTEQNFGIHADVCARGGVLADAVGMGKTAMVLALIVSEPVDLLSGPNLVVLPTHLMQQWESEAKKFVKEGEINVIFGMQEYKTFLTEHDNEVKDARQDHLKDVHLHQSDTSREPRNKVAISNRTIVLVSIKDVLDANRLYYDFRRVYREMECSEIEMEPNDTKSAQMKSSRKRKISSYMKDVTKEYADTLEEYRRSACFVNGGYRGNVYNGILHWPKKNWRRVILDEIQDLCQPGTPAQDNFVQLTRKTTNVWMVSATPFPLGDKSIYANHQLLGFHRLKLNVEAYHEGLPDNHPFELIKKRLYIRSAERCQKEAIVDKIQVNHETIEVNMHEVERIFYDNMLEEARHQESLRMRREAGADDNDDDDGDDDDYEAAMTQPDYWSPEYYSLREMCCHPAASSQIREEHIARNADGEIGNTDVTACMRQSLSSLARRTSENLGNKILDSNYKIETLSRTEKRTSVAICLAKVVQKHIETMDQETWTAYRHDVLSVSSKEDEEDEFVSSHLPLSEEELVKRIQEEAKQSGFSLESRNALELRKSALDVELSNTTFIVGYSPVSRYILRRWLQVSDAERYVKEQTSYLKKTQTDKRKETRRLEKYEKEKERFATLSMTTSRSDRHSMESKYGSKPAALVDFIRNNSDQKVIVFSMWDDVLKLVAATLGQNNIRVTYGDITDHRRQESLRRFKEDETCNVLFLSSESCASGANLQHAKIVILLDPPGKTARDGCALSNQAIGRSVRLGQTDPVRIIRFVLKDTIENSLFEDINHMKEDMLRASDKGDTYVLEGIGRELPKFSGPAVLTIDEKTLEEAAKSEMLRAKEEGNFIDLIDSPREYKPFIDHEARDKIACNKARKRLSQTSVKQEEE